MTGIAIVVVPLSAVWLALSFWLGRQQEGWERTLTRRQQRPEQRVRQPSPSTG